MMSGDTWKLHKNAEDNELLYRMAKECVALIDAKGGIGCSAEGVKKVGQILISMAEDLESQNKS